MIPIEHFLFFPVVVLLALVLIVLTWRLIARLFLFFFIAIAIWFGLYVLGVCDSPFTVLRQYQMKEKVQKSQVIEVHVHMAQKPMGIYLLSKNLFFALP